MESKYTAIEVVTLEVRATTNLDMYKGVTINGVLPPLSGDQIAGFTIRNIKIGEPIGVVRSGEAWAIAAENITVEDKLSVNTDGNVKIQTLGDAGCARALESVNIGDVFRILVIQDIAVTGGGVTAHSDLSGLATGDDHPQYAKGAGRAGGQTLIGGTAGGDDLNLESTSHPTKGDVKLGTTGKSLILYPSGIMSIEKQSNVKVHISSTQTIPSGSDRIVEFDDISKDNQNEFDDHNYRFRANIGGTYLVIVNLCFTVSFTSDIIISLKNNGNVIVIVKNWGEGDGSGSLSNVIDLKDGDRLDVFVTQNSGTNKILDGDHQLRSMLDIIKLI